MNTLAETVSQYVDPIDFDSAKSMLSRISAEKACQILPGAPYSIATNVLHAAIWQDHWLAGIRGERSQAGTSNDWPTVTPDEWPAARNRFLQGLMEAKELSIGSAHDEVQQRKLVQIAIHGAYDLGQIKLLKRLLQ